MFRCHVAGEREDLEAREAKGTKVGTIRGSEVDGEARAEVDDKEPHASHHVNHSLEKERAAPILKISNSPQVGGGWPQKINHLT